MSSRILKGLTVAAGAGLAIGLSSARQRQKISMSQSSSDDPIIERLDRIEARMSAMETANREALESMLDATLTPQVEKLRTELSADLQASMDEKLTAFEKSIDSKVSDRIAGVEKAVIDQSAIITALSQRAVEAEDNFQRLIGAVERLFEQREKATLFEKQLNTAMHQEPGAGFRPRIISEEEANKSRNRRPMTRL